MERETTRPAAPEWVTAVRRDRAVDSTLSGSWSVFSGPVSRGSAFTDFSNHAMTIPAGDSIVARGVRFHELLHARFSPSSVPATLAEQMGFPVETLRVAEEMRLNLLGRTAHYSPRTRANHVETMGVSDFTPSVYSEMSAAIAALQDGTEQKAADFCADQDDWRGAVYLMCSTWGTDVFRDVKRRLRRKPEWKDAVQEVTDRMRSLFGYETKNTDRGGHWQARAWSGTDPVAYKWRGRFAVQEVTLPIGFVQATMMISSFIEDTIQDKNDADGRGRDGELGDEPNPGGTPDLRVTSEARWVAPFMGMTSLTEATTRFLGRRKRPAAMGRRPVRPDRLITDPERRIFREEAPGIGGVVVFDCSGSMGVDYDVVRETVAQFAGATVLAYSAGDSKRPNMWVLARNGRMVSAEEMNRLELNRGNGVDGPALRHAVRLRRSPRDFVMWVSDVGVTGIGDYQHRDHLTDCADLCRRYNIVQVNDCDSALEKLAEMKRNGAMPRRSWEMDYLRQTIEEVESGRRPVPLVRTGRE